MNDLSTVNSINNQLENKKKTPNNTSNKNTLYVKKQLISSNTRKINNKKKSSKSKSKEKKRRKFTEEDINVDYDIVDDNLKSYNNHNNSKIREKYDSENDFEYNYLDNKHNMQKEREREREKRNYDYNNNFNNKNLKDYNKNNIHINEKENEYDYNYNYNIPLESSKVNNNMNNINNCIDDYIRKSSKNYDKEKEIGIGSTCSIDDQLDKKRLNYLKDDNPESQKVGEKQNLIHKNQFNMKKDGFNPRNLGVQKSSRLPSSTSKFNNKLNKNKNEYNSINSNNISQHSIPSVMDLRKKEESKIKSKIHYYYLPKPNTTTKAKISNLKFNYEYENALKNKNKMQKSKERELEEEYNYNYNYKFNIEDNHEVDINKYNKRIKVILNESSKKPTYNYNYKELINKKLINSNYPPHSRSLVKDNNLVEKKEAFLNNNNNNISVIKSRNNHLFNSISRINKEENEYKRIYSSCHNPERENKSKNYNLRKNNNYNVYHDFKYMYNNYNSIYNPQSNEKERGKHYKSQENYNPNTNLNKSLSPKPNLSRNHFSKFKNQMNFDYSTISKKMELQEDDSNLLSEYSLLNNNNYLQIDESANPVYYDVNDLSNNQLLQEIKKVIGMSEKESNKDLLKKIMKFNIKDRVKEEFLLKLVKLCSVNTNIKHNNVNLINMWRWIKETVNESQEYKEVKDYIKAQVVVEKDSDFKKTLMDCFDKSYKRKKGIDRMKRLLSAEPKS